MTARKTASEKDEKTAGTDQSKTTETTKQAEEREVASKPEEVGDLDVKGAASGSVAGGVPRGQSDFDDFGDDDDRDDFDAFKGDEVEGALGTTVEADREGNQHDAPYALLTPAFTARTSDSDDPAKDWTAQHAAGEREDEDGNALDAVALVPVQGVPGQTFKVGELPNRHVAEAAGIDYDQWVAGLPVRAEVPDEGHRRGTPA